jgi:hypothetical protein
MKKMNLFFLTRVFDGLNSRKGLMTFILLFLFGFGFNTVSAQYVSTEVAINRLKDASREITKNYEALQNSGNQEAFQKAQLKLDYLTKFLVDLKQGASVKNTVNKYIGFPNTVAVKDFQLYEDPKNGHHTGWLKDEILKMLKL